MGFPIDVLYLDQSMKVIRIQSEMRPWRIAPVHLQSSSVLELPSRMSAQTATAVGDKIEITETPVPADTGQDIFAAKGCDQPR
jgi:uncharacterized membrane protein (UPF0127 family)